MNWVRHMSGAASGTGLSFVLMFFFKTIFGEVFETSWYPIPDFTTDFIDTRPSNKNSGEHLAIRFRQSCAPYMVL